MKEDSKGTKTETKITNETGHSKITKENFTKKLAESAQR